MSRFCVWTVVAVSGWAAASAPAPTIRVAAASDLQAALPVIAAQFQKDTGVTVALTFGSSGNFFAQIQNGAPFDLFLSADIDYPRQLERAGLADPNSLVAYATGRLVLWTRTDSGIDLRAGLSSLLDGRVRRIAIANPAHAPYGRAAVAALRHEGLYERVQSKLVLGENISQAAQFAQSGNADVGLLALSLAVAPAMKSSGSYVEVPAALHPAIEQAAVVLASSSQKAAAQRFLTMLTSAEGQRILQSYGFARPRLAAPGLQGVRPGVRPGV
jgi:molybdate transport system substrate-binding protein